MKKTLISFLLLIGCFTAIGQNRSTDTLSLKNMEIPSSPGFVLLDQAPSGIVRPNNTKAITASLLNSFAETNGFPKNFAIELTPFWFFKYKTMSVLKYAGFSNGKANPFASAKIASLSLAYVNTTDSLTSKPISNIAFGARTTILKIYPKDHTGKIIGANRIAIGQLMDLGKAQVAAGATPILKITNPKRYNEIADSVQRNWAVKDTLEKVMAVKPLLALDGAIAYNSFFKNNDYATNQFGRFGAWLTLSFTQSLKRGNYLNLYALGRYMSDGTSKNLSGDYQRQSINDVGGKIEFEINKVIFSYEYIHRTTSNHQTTQRSTGLIKYRLAENISLTGAFGKNFGTTNNLVALLGISWGLSFDTEKAKIE